MARICNEITETIGGTPLVRLNRITQGLSATVLAKIEFFNPSGSVKDRIGAAIIDTAEKRGELKPGGAIIECTSGNTGISLAMVGAARGYHVILTMPETMSLERRTVLKAFGAQLVLTPGAAGMRGAVEKAEDLARETPGAVLARQFTNTANPQIHYDTTGPEIWEATDGNVDVFVAGVGTGGTITGAGKYLKEKNPRIRIIAVEPEDSPLLNGGLAGPHKIQGIGANFIPEVLDTKLYDQVIAASLEKTLETARALGTHEGILGGISSGASVWAALEEAKKPENKGKTIVVVIPDFGERYISTVLYADIRE